MEKDVEDELRRFTKGKVSFMDVAEPIPLAHAADGNAGLSHTVRTVVQPADFVFCIEVAEHIPPANMPVFLENLNYLGKKGMILSWASELCGLGWGHVNCLDAPLGQYIEKHTDYVYDDDVTKQLRATSNISWIQKSVAFFRKRGFDPRVIRGADGEVRVTGTTIPAGPSTVTEVADLARRYHEKVTTLKQEADKNAQAQASTTKKFENNVLTGGAIIGAQSRAASLARPDHPYHAAQQKPTTTGQMGDGVRQGGVAKSESASPIKVVASGAVPKPAHLVAPPAPAPVYHNSKAGASPQGSAPGAVGVQAAVAATHAQHSSRTAGSELPSVKAESVTVQQTLLGRSQVDLALAGLRELAEKKRLQLAKIKLGEQKADFADCT